MAELLLELLSEEIPARMQGRASDDLCGLVGKRLKAAGLEFASAVTYATPRRLTLVVDGLPEKQPDVSEEKKGPKVGAPEQALAGFMRANGLSSIDQAEVRDLGKGQFYFAVIETKGRPTAEVLVNILNDAIAALPWPKSMRWGSYEKRWVRPLHSILCLFAGQVVPVAYGPVSGGDSTVGHRFMAPDRFSVAGFADYRAKLRAAKVVLDAAERRDMIKTRSADLAAAEGLSVKDSDGLLSEVAGLVEWPVPLMGTIDDEFMSVPHEVLTLSMATHQKYFSTLDKDGNLAPRFVVVANREGTDGGLAITAGNERVLRARLSDAKFFWDQDRRSPLESRIEKLSEVVFHAKLGTLLQKVQRVEKLAENLCRFIDDADPEHVARAARLAKADLMTDMVYEFPEVQGTMGRYYARHDGEHEAVADAIADHYSPLGPGDDCPRRPNSVAVALADKIDTLVGFYGIDEKPTGSKDPFALRRAALGIIRLIVENRLRVSLNDVFDVADANYAVTSGHAHGGLKANELMDFFADRLKVHLREQGVHHDLVSAVFALGGEDDLVRLLARVDALKAFLATEDGDNLLVAYRRAANIVRIEEKKDGRQFSDVSSSLFVQDEEANLWRNLHDVEGALTGCLRDEQFQDAMTALATMRTSVDMYFDQVTVNSENKEQRANRLGMLRQIVAVMNQVADFSKIGG